MEHSAVCAFRGSQVVKYPVNPVGNLFPGESCSFHLAARPVGLRPRRVFSSWGCVSDRVRPASSNTNLPPLTSRVKHWSKLWESQPTGSSLTLPPSSNHDQHCWPTSGSLHHRHTDSAMPSHGATTPAIPTPSPHGEQPTPLLSAHRDLHGQQDHWCSHHCHWSCCCHILPMSILERKHRVVVPGCTQGWGGWVQSHMFIPSDCGSPVTTRWNQTWSPSRILGSKV